MPFAPHSWGLFIPLVWGIIVPLVWGLTIPLVWGIFEGHIDPLSRWQGRQKLNKQKTYYMKELIGQVTPEEKQEIQTLFERRNGLNELAKIVTADNTELYERLVRDLGETGTKFQRWWDAMGEKYHWRGAEGGNWEINFDTNEIYLVTP